MTTETEPFHWQLYPNLGWGSRLACARTHELGYNRLVVTADTTLPSMIPPDVEHYRWHLIDDAFMVTLPSFQEKIEVYGQRLAAHIRAGDRVLITCAEGYNRSALLAARTLWELKGWAGITIVAAIKERRPSALFNMGFREWIESWKGK